MRIAALALALALSAAPGLAWAQATQPAAPAGRATAPAPSATPAGKAELLDINSASAEQLDALPGIGPARAASIIKGRPYKGKDELVQKGILTKTVYDGIKDKIIARQK